MVKKFIDIYTQCSRKHLTASHLQLTPPLIEFLQCIGKCVLYSSMTGFNLSLLIMLPLLRLPAQRPRRRDLIDLL